VSVAVLERDSSALDPASVAQRPEKEWRVRVLSKFHDVEDPHARDFVLRPAIARPAERDQR